MAMEPSRLDFSRADRPAEKLEQLPRTTSLKMKSAVPAVGTEDELRARLRLKVIALHAVLAKLRPVVVSLRMRIEERITVVRSEDMETAWRWAGIAVAIAKLEAETDRYLKHFGVYLESRVQDENALGSLTLTALGVVACRPFGSSVEWFLSTLSSEGLLFDARDALSDAVASLKATTADIPNFVL
jgi:hypothetical protein